MVLLPSILNLMHSSLMTSYMKDISMLSIDQNQFALFAQQVGRQMIRRRAVPPEVFQQSFPLRDDHSRNEIRGGTLRQSKRDARFVLKVWDRKFGSNI